jgi:hypothetical protein
MSGSLFNLAEIKQMRADFGLPYVETRFNRQRQLPVDRKDRIVGLSSASYITTPLPSQFTRLCIAFSTKYNMSYNTGGEVWIAELKLDSATQHCLIEQDRQGRGQIQDLPAPFGSTTVRKIAHPRIQEAVQAVVYGATQ